MVVRSFPDLSLERELYATGFSTLCGVDEAGRGPLCGPVVAAAVVLPPCSTLPDTLLGLDDSKRLTPGQRTSLAEAIQRESLACGIALADVTEIDRLNIRRATLLAMSRAVKALRSTTLATPVSPAFILIDGRDLPEELPCPARAVIHGDQISASIAAASILAKTHRDRIMLELASRYPGYGWERNAGYPTGEHLRALATLGVTPEHRRTYGPVARIIAEAS
ncbi:MAG: ribonuclease HII [Magnetococcales bacterium]|nr:ribonuclease HII [Magnetococcales bacterium]